MKQVLIADHSVPYSALLADFLNKQPDMHVAGIAGDGEQALNLIASLQPDVVILDLTLPLLDGMAVMERMGDAGLAKEPQVIVLTALGTDVVMQRLLELGAAYFMMKPCDLDMLARRIRQFTDVEIPPFLQETKRSFAQSATYEEEVLVTRLLHEIGVPPHYKGYKYLRDAVLLSARSDSAFAGSLTRELYPRLAEKYHATAGGVEAAIRNSVMACWEGGNRDYLAKLTASAGARRKTFPTNSIVIARLVEELRSRRQHGAVCNFSKEN